MPKTIVITGGSHGLGRGVAEAFLSHGWNVFITSPTARSVDAAVAALQAQARGGAGAAGLARDVALDAQPVWDAAVAVFGAVDVWFNSAGLALTGRRLEDLAPADFKRMLDTNVLGVMQGCRTAFAGMKERGGAIYNMYGAGSDGVPVPGMIGYATTKRAVQFFTESFALETAGTKVIVGGLSPGLVMTEGFRGEHAKTPKDQLAAREAVVNFIGDHVETSADWIYRCITGNTTNGKAFTWLTKRRLNARRKAMQSAPRDILSRYR